MYKVQDTSLHDEETSVYPSRWVLSLLAELRTQAISNDNGPEPGGRMSGGQGDQDTVIGAHPAVVVQERLEVHVGQTVAIGHQEGITPSKVTTDPSQATRRAGILTRVGDDAPELVTLGPRAIQ